MGPIGDPSHPRRAQIMYCGHCDMAFNLKRLFKLHVTHAHKDLPLSPCKKCDKEFASVQDLATHVWTKHVPQEDVSCRYCGQSFRIASEMMKHVSQNHTTQCPVCLHNFETSQEAQLQNHECTEPSMEEIMASPLKTVTCSQCRLFLPDKTDYPHHKLVCRPFSCPLCPKVYNTQEGLRNHFKIHSDAPIVCDQCPEVCENKKIFYRHMTSKHPTQVYKCAHCPKVLTTKQKFTQHTFTHTKPFICPVCNEGFQSKGLLKCHQVTHTGAVRFLFLICIRNEGLTEKKILETCNLLKIIQKQSQAM